MTGGCCTCPDCLRHRALMTEIVYRRKGDLILLAVPWGFRSQMVPPEAIRFERPDGFVDFRRTGANWRNR